MLNWDKGKDEQKNSSADYIQKMGKEMDIICEELSKETKTFKAKNFFDKIHEYIMKNDRLIYTHITNYIFMLKEENFGILQTNIDSVVSYMYSDEYQQDFSEWLDDNQKKLELEKTQRTVLKMWDHVNLARRQYLMFQRKDTEYEKIVDEKMIKDGHHIYEMMVVENTNQDIQYNQEDMMFGPVLRKNKDELFIRYWQKQYQTYLKIMKDLPSNHPRYLELEKQKQLIEGELNESL